MTETDPDEPQLGASQELRGFSGTDALYAHAYDEPMGMLRFDAATGMVYESRSDGVGIIDPRTGRRIHHVGSRSGFWDTALPDVEGGAVYVLGTEHGISRDMESRRAPMGVIAAFRHP